MHTEGDNPQSAIRNPQSRDFIRTIIAEDLKNNKHGGKVTTRFPPEPNGFLHIGHAKSICLNFGVALENNGVCHLRFDDTNPSKEEIAYVESIKKDVKWLGFDWGANLFFASDYFEQLYDYAVALIKMGKAYVCSLSADEIREYRGTLTEPGRESPYRNRSVEENLDLFARMRAGEFSDGTHVLRAKIDMSSGNINMRDPVLYRILHASHHRTGDKWCIYPMYDYTHPISDAIEQITHSLCTLEFEDHRPFYDWLLDTLRTPSHPQQIEFARLNLTFTVMSKRKLLQLVNEKYVSGWDDPRMLTISGLRRRGYTPAAMRSFCDTIGLAKRESRVDMGVLENAIRNDLNDTAPRAMAVLSPLKVMITNYPPELEEELEIDNHPKNPDMGKRTVTFCREIYIERDDFLEEPPKKFFRLAPGREVRLRAAYLITCDEVVRDERTGEIVELRCTYDPASRGGSSPDGRKVKGTLHWVSARHAITAEVRLYDRLFNVENPEADKETSFMTHLNPDSLQLLSNCRLEPGLAAAGENDRYQFERLGYFCLDSVDSTPARAVFNRTVTLRDSWEKIEKNA
jgi:glutaminyl-tRNA synthetase